LGRWKERHAAKKGPRSSYRLLEGVGCSGVAAAQPARSIAPQAALDRRNRPFDAIMGAQHTRSLGLAA
jgi:hypothetical protein